MTEDYIELLAHLTGAVKDDGDWDAAEVEDKLYEKFEIDIDTAQDFLAALMPFVPALQGPLSGTAYHCLGIHKGDVFIALAKSPVKARNDERN